MPLIENTESMRLGLLADQILVELRGKVKFIKNFGTGFDLQPGQRDNEYIVNKITDGTLTLRERENDNDPVVDDQSGNDKVVLKTTQVYNSETHGQKFMDSVTGRRRDDYVKNQASLLATGIETRGISAITELIMPASFGSKRYLGKTASTIKFTDYEDAKIFLNDENHEEENGKLFTLQSNQTLKDSVALSEFQNFNVQGPGSLSNISGEAESDLYGFFPQRSNLIRKGNPQGVGNHTSDLNEGGNIDAVVTTFSADNQSPVLDNFPILANDDSRKQIKPGQVIIIDNENILVTGITYLTVSTYTITSCVRGWWNTTAASHLNDAQIVVVDSKANLFYQGNQIISAFARQEEFNDARGIKVTAADEDNSMFLTILKEPVSGKGGMWRYMISIDIGFAILRDTAVIPAVFEH